MRMIYARTAEIDFRALLRLSDPETRDRAEACLRRGRGAEIALGRYLARVALSRLTGLDPASVPLAHDDRGRPFFPDHPEWFVSISRGDGLAAALVHPEKAVFDLQAIRRFPGEAVRGFFSALKKNFFQGVILGAIALLGAVIIYADGAYAFSLTGTMKIMFCIVTGIVGAVWLTYVCYVFALQARYEKPVKDQIKNAFLLAFVSPVKTILMWIILAIPVLLILYLPQSFIAYASSLFIMFGISLPAFCNSAILRGIFDRFDPKEEPFEEE